MIDLSKFDFIKMEEDILKFWEKNQCFKKLQEKNANNKLFKFLDGPITANNPMGVHHAWGRTIKDIFLRYKSMNGYTSHYKNGFDAQGLWVEVEVEKELGFKDKKDIELYGMDKFTDKCIQRVKNFSNIITEQSKRLGQWMDWNNSYFTNTDENIIGIWHFLKKCHQNGWLKKTYKPMPWCPRCGTSLSEHEMTGSYKTVKHTSVFGKLPIVNKNFDIMVWTTTPWTLAANVALAVNPEFDYLLLEYDDNEKPIVLSKNALKYLDNNNNNNNNKIIGTIKGRELIGLTYETFFPDLEIQKEITHTIVAWDKVSAEDGSGVVHIAPGCGAEDFELSRTLNLPEICPIDENGAFYDNCGFLSNKLASEVSNEVFNELKRCNKLFKTVAITHSYPVCWRCKTEILFRLVREWSIDTAEIKPQLMEAIKTVKWEPEHTGKRMYDWLLNMGDWNISRKRFYGLPLPIYVCGDCNEITVVGSMQEFKELGGKDVLELPHLHRPWIDFIKITCPKCGNKVSRIKEVGDVWLDAGIVPFSTLGYFNDREKWEKYYPAEWVTEMKEQIRLWFYSLLFMSVTLTGKAPYKHVLTYGSVISEDGSKFSKTGFMIKFDDAANKIGADVIRYLFASTNVMNDVRFGFNLGEEVRKKLLGFWNIYVFFNTYACLENFNILQKLDEKVLDDTDKWLNARIKFFVKNVKEAYEIYNTQIIINEFEQCVKDISNWYIRINRKRFWRSENSDSKISAFVCLYNAIKTLVIVMAPIIPFMNEFIWQDVVRRFENNAVISVHLNEFPGEVKFLEQEENLLKDIKIVRQIITLALKLRNEKQLKVKQPLAILYIVAPLNHQSTIMKAESIIKEELNIKEIAFLENTSSLQKCYLTLNFKEAGLKLKDDLNKVKLALEKTNNEDMQKLVSLVKENKSVKLNDFEGELSSELFALNFVEKDHVCLTSENEFTVGLNIELTDNLIKEGIYREVLRNCQVIRKEAGFRVEQKIYLGITSEDTLVNEVLSQYRDQLTFETLALKLTNVLERVFYEKEISVDKRQLKIQMLGL